MWNTSTTSMYKCPQCRGPLEQVERPINVQVQVCRACGKEWTTDYIAGWWDGYYVANTEHAMRANTKRPTSRAADSPSASL